MQTIAFETVTVNEHGEIIRRETLTAPVFVETLPGGVAQELIAGPEGRFLMGSRAGSGYPDERPQHSVQVPAFFLGRFPVTQAQWNAIMPQSLPWRTPGATHPADRVSWHAAMAFCARVSQATGRGYHLPSEAEWEYACRGGTTTPFAFGHTLTTDLANYVGEHTYGAGPKGVYRHGSTEAGAFPPNAFGINDMHGNVWEWCADAWHDDYTGVPSDGSAWTDSGSRDHVLRGGCWHDPPDLCRSAARLRQSPDSGEDYFGFRVALGRLENVAPPGDRAVHRFAARLMRRIRDGLEK